MVEIIRYIITHAKGFFSPRPWLESPALSNKILIKNEVRAVRRVSSVIAVWIAATKKSRRGGCHDCKIGAWISHIWGQDRRSSTSVGSIT